MKFTFKTIKYFFYFSMIFAPLALVHFEIQNNSPTITKWLTKKVNSELGKQNIDIEIKSENIQFYLLSFGFSAKNLEVSGKQNNYSFFLNIETISGQIQLLPLLFGKIKIKHGKLESGELTLSVKEKKESEKKPVNRKRLFGFFKKKETKPLIDLNNILFSNFEAKEFKVKARYKDYSFRIDTKNVLLKKPFLFQKKWNLSSNTKVSVQSPTDEMKFSTNLNATISQTISLSLSINKDNNKINLQGTLPNTVSLDGLKLNGTQKINLDIVKKVFSLINKPFDVYLKGIVIAQLNITKSDDYNIDYYAQTEDIQINKSFLGKSYTEGTIKKNKIIIKKSNISLRQDNLQLEDFSINMTPPYRFKTQVIVNEANFKNIWVSLTSKTPSVDFLATAIASCTGKFKKFDLECNLKNIKGEKLILTNAKRNNKFISNIPAFQTTGFLKYQIEKGELTYEGGVTVSNETSGNVSIFADLKNKLSTISFQLENYRMIKDDNFLNLEGITDLSGKINLDKKKAHINISLFSDELTVYDFYLGRTVGNITYKDKKLFHDFKSRINQSDISTNLSFDFSERPIYKELDIVSEEMDLSSLKEIFKNINDKIDISGIGSLNFNLKGREKFINCEYNGTIKSKTGILFFGNYLSSLDMSVNSLAGLATIGANLKKDKEILGLAGTTFQWKDFNITALGKKINLHNIYQLNKKNIRLPVLSDINGTFQGSFKKPKLNLNLEFYKENGVDSRSRSTLSVITDKKTTLSVNLFNKTFIGKILFQSIWPKDIEKFDIETDAFNINELASLLKPHEISELFSDISGDFQYKKENNDNWSVQSNIKKFFLKSSNYELNLKDRKKISINSNESKIENFNLYGNNHLFTIKASNKPKKQFTIVSKGALPLSLLKIFSNKINYTNSLFYFNSSWTKNKNRPWEQLSNIFLKNGKVNVFGLEDNIQNIMAQISITNKSIFLKKIKGNIKKGSFAFDGKLELNKNIKINGEINNIPIQISSKKEVLISGTTQISGKKFPLLLEGDLKVSSKGFLYEKPEFSLKNIFESNLISRESISNNQTVSPLKLQLNLDIDNFYLLKPSLFNAHLSGKINILGSLSTPYAKGDIYINKGSFFYQSKQFDFSGGTSYLSFNEDRLNIPDIFAQAQATLDPYLVKVDISGTSKEPLISFSSEPELPSQSLLNLIIFDTQPGEEEDPSNFNTSETGIQSASTSIGKYFLYQSPLFQEINNRFGIKLDLDFKNSLDAGSSAEIRIKKTLQKDLTISAATKLSELSDLDISLTYDIDKNWALTSYLKNGSTIEDELEGSLESEFLNKSISLGLGLEYNLDF